MVLSIRCCQYEKSWMEFFYFSYNFIVTLSETAYLIKEYPSGVNDFSMFFILKGT